MSRIIAVANQKGGVGKTTTTLNLGAALVENGYSVLLIDLDPQGSLTTALGFEPEEIEQTIYDVIHAVINEKQEPTIHDVLFETEAKLDLVPSNIELSAAELDLFQATMGELILREIFDNTKLKYDFLLIDCPPNLGGLTVNALSASDEVVIPLQADYLALKGVNLLMKTISTVQRKINRKLKIAGVLLTMADLRTRHTREVISSARDALHEQVRVFESVVRLNVQVKEASVAGESIIDYSENSNVARAYRKLAKELCDE